QHLPRLAAVAWLGAGERAGREAAREAARELASWLDQNPPKLGIHWHSSLEIALRSLSWLWTIFLLLPTGVLDDAALQRVLRSLLAPLDHVHRYPSFSSSPNTHLLGEATALYVGGLLFEECERARAWFARGRTLLAAEMERQVGADGVHAELSTW